MAQEGTKATTNYLGRGNTITRDQDCPYKPLCRSPGFCRALFGSSSLAMVRGEDSGAPVEMRQRCRRSNFGSEDKGGRKGCTERTLISLFYRFSPFVFFFLIWFSFLLFFFFFSTKYGIKRKTKVQVKLA